MIAQNGGFRDNDPADTFQLLMNGPRWDQNYGEWAWSFVWPGGAPSGLTIDFDAYCVNGPA